MKMQEIKYRVYDSKGNFQQSYSNQLSSGYAWAKDCAKRMAGYIVEYSLTDGKEVSNGVVFDLRSK